MREELASVLQSEMAKLSAAGVVIIALIGVVFWLGLTVLDHNHQLIMEITRCAS